MNSGISTPQSHAANRKVFDLIPWQPLTNRNFRLLWIGQSISLLGDQIYLVALPLLTLQLNGSGLELATVLMATTIPRAALELFGGAASDQFSPHTLILISNAGRAVCVAILTALIMLDSIRLWHLYPLAIALGLADAFFYPAFKSFIASIVNQSLLASSNTLTQISNQFAKFVGPLLASLTIAAIGFGMAFSLDFLTFTIAILLLLMMKKQTFEKAEAANNGAPQSRNLFVAVREGLRYSFKDPLIRIILILTTVLEFSFAGPFLVGLPTLVKQYFVANPTAFGAMLSTFGGAMLLGTFLAPLIIKLRNPFLIYAGSICVSGLLLMFIGFVRSLLAVCVMIGLIGIGAGIAQILTLTWLQSRSDPQFRGRVISVLTFAGYVFAPLSLAMAGAVVDINVKAVFMVGGILMIVAATAAFSSKAARQFGLALPQESDLDLGSGQYRER
jgi:MFS family permease